MNMYTCGSDWRTNAWICIMQYIMHGYAHIPAAACVLSTKTRPPDATVLLFSSLRDMTHSCIVRHGSLMCVWPIFVPPDVLPLSSLCDMTHSCMWQLWHASFVLVTLLIYRRDLNHFHFWTSFSFVGNAFFEVYSWKCVFFLFTWHLATILLSVTRHMRVGRHLINMHEMVNSCMWHRQLKGSCCT